MRIKLTRAQVRQLKPYMEWLRAQPRQEYGPMLVAQIAHEYPDEMRVGVIPAKKARAFVNTANDKVLAAVGKDGGT
ncbi:MAG TPA: hypothetical protein VMU47_06755 [Caldimonas sp.]|nr:hypothetical protein [Caldimonas sp.]